MLRDVFYYGQKPNAHPREKFAVDLIDARSQATTEHFWIINEFCDYRNFDWDFDFDFLPDEDVWTQEHNNIWPSQHQKDSGTWLCPKEHSDINIYRADVDPVIRKNVKSENWVLLDSIDESKFDFSWHPDPTDPPFIYKWGCKFFPAQLQHVLEYRVKNAIESKYMDQVVELSVSPFFKEIQKIKDNSYLKTWRPDPLDPPFIYIWGNKHIPGELKSTVEYHVPGATDKKYMQELLEVEPEYENWVEYIKVDKNKFDLSWRPDPREPAYIYVWGNKYDPPETKPTVEYYTLGATDKKYMGIIDLEPEWDRWKEYEKIDKSKFDFSWRPDPNLHEPAYIYVWGNKYVPGEIQPTLEYHVPGAIDKKYMGNVDVLPEYDRWVEHVKIDKNKFDLTWRPDPREPAYIYVWGNKYDPPESKPTLEYYVPGATDKKYMGIIDLEPEWDRWKEYEKIDKSKFDFSWRPDPNLHEPPYIYVWGNKYVPGELQPTLEYHVPGAIEKKYMGNVDVLPQYDRWIEHVKIDKNKFDLSWRPDPREPAYIYVWGNRYVPGEIQPTLEYHVPGATDKKYMGDVEVLPIWENYKILIPVDKTSFDFNWRPDPREPAYIYVWGNQYNKAEIEPTIEYYCTGATERKYMHDQVANTLPIVENWKILLPVENFDFSWRPDPHSPPYIYVFGNQWYDATLEPTLEYHVPGATNKKYVTDIVAHVSIIPERWKQLIPVDNFDFTWRPHPHDPPYIYVFGNQWHNVTLEPTLEYHMPEATEKKYITDIVAYTKPDMKNWTTTYQVENFDYSWRPHPHNPPMIYQFGTLLDDIHLKDGPVYTVPGNDGTVVYLENKIASKSTIIYPKYYIETTLEDLIKNHTNEIFWALRKNINYDKFDFSWTPTKENVFHINVFGSPESETTQTYFVNGPMINNGYSQKNYIDNIKLDDNYLATLFKPMDMFYVDKGNSQSNERFEKLKQRFPNIKKTRYLNTWVDTINRCLNKCDTELCWVLNSELDYTDFNFEYYPNPWQMKMVHVFGTQWSHWGTTFVINKESFPNDTKYVKIIEHLPNINFVKKTKAKATNCLYEIYIVDHGNNDTNNVYELIRQKINSDNVYVIKYENSYLKTFANLLEEIPIKKDHYLWVCSSVCDYSNFDFSYVCDPFAKDQLHVFPNDKQKFGDTFLIDVNKLRTLISDMNLLDDYEKINFNQHQNVKRLPYPTIISDDTHTESVNLEFDFPYALVKTKDNINLKIDLSEPPSLWNNKSKTITILSEGGTNIFLPKEAKKHVVKELYDYPYIVKSKKLAKSNPLDIVFLSNGESIADANYEHLLKVIKGLPNRVVRVDGVVGRVNAYHAAAKASNTPWMFTVFAKLRVNENFDWNWQPDRLQVPKHYIFYATNPVNDLEYGHQAMIAYNKNIVLNNPGVGLDFTLDNAHEVLPYNSGVAHYNTDPFSTWRTAFREAIKLKADDSPISKERLVSWVTRGNGMCGKYSIQGALDGVAYYTEVKGDINKLKLSYDWEWLSYRFKL